MERLNLYGLLFIALLMIPNIVFGLKCPEGFRNIYHNKLVETLEQIGRFGCMAAMVFEIPGVCIGFWFAGAKMLYLILGAVLMALYWLGWIVYWKKDSLTRALVLSILPPLLFLESGVLSGNILLTVLSGLFAYAHITISCGNAV